MEASRCHYLINLLRQKSLLRGCGRSLVAAARTLQQHQLPAIWLPQAGYPEAEQAQRTAHQFLSGEQKATQAVDLTGFCQRVLDRYLSRESGEVAVAQLDLDGVGAQAAAFEPGRNVLGLGPQTGPQHLAVFSIPEKGFLPANAFDFIAQLQRAVVLPQRKLP